LKYKVIAIDGPAGAGKSTIAKRLSIKLGYTHIDSGSLFRAITYIVIKLGIDINDVEAIIHHTKNSTIDFMNNSIYLNGVDISAEIRENAVNTKVSYIAMIPEIRDIVVNIQRKIAANKNVVVDGRDIGTTVFPRAFIKFFLTASIEERARRRYNELLDKEKFTLEEIKKQIIERDYIDTNREASPLRQAEDAILIDTSGKNVDEVVSEMLYYISIKGEV